MNWVIQENLYNEAGFEALLRALEAMELPHSVHKVVPFSHELIPDVNPVGPTIVMGAYTMTSIAESRGWKPGAYSNENFDFVPQWAAWGDRMLNADARVSKLKDVSWPEAQDYLFVRPTADSKLFTGTLMATAEFAQWRQNILSLGWEGTVTPDTQVMIALPRCIYREYRTWIVNSRVVTASLYKEGTHVRYDSNVDEAVIQYAEECAAIWSPHRAYVLDVADTPNGLRILEINCLNGAGFYAGNVGKIVASLEALEGKWNYAERI